LRRVDRDIVNMLRQTARVETILKVSPVGRIAPLPVRYRLSYPKMYGRRQRADSGRRQAGGIGQLAEAMLRWPVDDSVD
jgi:hypothetical protein